MSSEILRQWWRCYGEIKQKMSIPVECRLNPFHRSFGQGPHVSSSLGSFDGSFATPQGGSKISSSNIRVKTPRTSIFHVPTKSGQHARYRRVNARSQSSCFDTSARTERMISRECAMSPILIVAGWPTLVRSRLKGCTGYRPPKSAWGAQRFFPALFPPSG